MPRQQLLRKPLSLSCLTRPLRRFQSSASDTKTRTRATRILDRVPRYLRKYTDGLRNAPISHVVSFLILHELTAVVPLVGLAGGFHYWGLPTGLFSDTSYLAPGIEKFGRYFRRKGWFGLDKEPPFPTDGTSSSTEFSTEAVQGQAQAQNWNLDFNRPGTRIVVEVAAAYAITKALLPLRLMLSVWATPWFARVVVGRVWNGALGLGRAGRGTAAIGGAEAVGRSAAAAAGGTGTMGKAAKEVGKNIPKT